MAQHYFDLHIHSNHSFDSSMHIGTILTTARLRGLDGVAITDHDRLTPFESPYDDLIAIPGEEVRVEGYADIIGLGLTEGVEAGLPLVETIDLIHDQDALVIVPHPFSTKERYPALGDRLYDIIDRVDAIEVLNPKPFIDNQRARRVAAESGCGKVGGSDAHRAQDIGTGVTVTVAEDVRSMDDLLTAIKAGETTGIAHDPPGKRA